MMAERWRVGTHYGIHLYRCGPDGTTVDDEPVGTMLTPELAAQVVEAVNQYRAVGRTGETVEDCGCPVRYAVARIEEHTYKCGSRKAAERLASHLDEAYGDEESW